jgi:hypothetical protein
MQREQKFFAFPDGARFLKKEALSFLAFAPLRPAYLTGA